MAKVYFVLLSTLLLSGKVAAQMPLDTGSFNRWPTAGDAKISDDGKYVFYHIDPPDRRENVLVVKAIDEKQTIVVKNVVGPAEFCDNGASVVSMVGQDSLCIVHISTGAVEYKDHVRNFLSVGKYLAWLSDQANKRLTIFDCSTHKITYTDHVVNYQLGRSACELVLQQETYSPDASVCVLLLNLVDGQQSAIWTGHGPQSFVFDRAGKRIYFLGGVAANKGPALFCYETDSAMAQAVPINLPDSGNCRFVIDRLDDYDPQEGLLFLSVRKSYSRLLPSPVKPNLRVWSYRDENLFGENAGDDPNRSYTCVLHTADLVFQCIEGNGDRMLSRNGGSALIWHTGTGPFEERNWNRQSASGFYLVSLKGASRKFISNYSCSLSTGGEYVVWYDPEQKNYFAYEIASGITRNITSDVPVRWTIFNGDDPTANEAADPPEGWTAADDRLVLHDQNDLWLVDPAGQKPAKCLTDGYGLRQHIIFRFCDLFGDKPVPMNENILISAFNTDTKDNGFYRVNLTAPARFVKLTMGPYLYYVPLTISNFLEADGEAPIKAKLANRYLVERMSSTSSLNYFMTRDFKVFESVSDLHPEKNYNWLTTQLVSWTLADSSVSQGVLYKPENFDPSKKYPLIFYYYEKLSDNLNVFSPPKASNGPLNIPWMVSHGYLVFTPDIHYRTGHPGESALKTITSAASYLAKLPYVDSLHMGLQGHSFGGYETNYIVTHCNRFAAACSASGICDFVSFYTSPYFAHMSAMPYTELSQGRMGQTLWMAPDHYINESPLFNADKITTPLMLLYDKGDGPNYPQGVQFFTALRRLGKKAWMLQYDGEGHTLSAYPNQQDYTIRMLQFFDHYLKGAPVPTWMVEPGFTGFEREPPGVDPGPGLLKPEAQKQVDSLMYRKPIRVTSN